MKIPMVATGKFTYARRPLAPGDTFDAHSERDAKALELIRKAHRAPSRPSYETRNITAAPQPESVSQPEPAIAPVASGESTEEQEGSRPRSSRRNQRYHTRDLQAE